MKNAIVRRSHPLSLPIKMVWVAIGMAVLFNWGVSAFTSRYEILIDPQTHRCIPEYQVYLLKKHIRSIKKGHIYLFKAHGMGPFFKEGEPIGKYARGLEGDTVVQNAQGVFINGVRIVTGYPAAEKLHVQPEHYYKTYQLKKGDIFFSGTAWNSFDSRYWGVANQNQVIGEAIPLW